LGAEKFFDIKCRYGRLRPAAAVVVATARALKHHGGIPRKDLGAENVGALEGGLPNLAAHLDVLERFHVPAVVAINVFSGDSDAELARIEAFCAERGVPSARTAVHARGGAGGAELAERVVALARRGAPDFEPLYPLSWPLTLKIDAIATGLYGADGVEYSRPAEREIARMEALGLGALPVCIAKTQYSLSDDPSRLGRPRGFHLTVTEARPSAGAGFVVVLTGDIMTMPGLPRRPAAEGMHVDPDGTTHGLF
jgi:formate--tetrahydrofolate ligase